MRSFRRLLPLHCALALVALAACVDAPAAAPEPDAGPDEAATVALIPLTPEVAQACAAEVTATACSTHAAAALERSCRAKLAAQNVACATPDACLVTYRPQRDDACRAGPTYPDRAACAAPVADDCAFYRSCLDAAHPCGADGYARAFGERLCNTFVARREEFTPAGQAWLRGVRTCLQRALVPVAADASLTCETLTDAAYASHAGCYTDPANSVCALSSADLTALTRVLAPWLRDPRAIAQIGQVLQSCNALRDGGTVEQ